MAEKARIATESLMPGMPVAALVAFHPHRIFTGADCLLPGLKDFKLPYWCRLDLVEWASMRLPKQASRGVSASAALRANGD
ncbi:hypothetical protein NKI04_26475 [Mesorhizobium sp. M0814]|uniref:hypothetical protein n=1 Tax=Mesorhizobium sp. M0814 TaxID=2957004 RepID=UPI003339AEF9